MAAHKTAKWIAIAFAIPVVLIILGIAAAKIFFTGDRLRAMVIPPMESALRRQVGIGRISLSVLPAVALDIDSLRISPPGETSFQEKEFVSLDHLTISVKWLPLLTGKVELAHVLLIHPVVHLEVTRAGEKNYSAGSSQPSVSPAVKSSGGAAVLAIGSWEVQKGAFELLNNKSGTRLRLENIDISASASSEPGGKLSFSAIASAESLSCGSPALWYISHQPFSSAMTLSYDPAEDLLSLKDFRGKLGDLPVIAVGKVAGLRRETPMMDLRVSAPDASLQELLSLVPRGILKNTGGLTATGTAGFSAGIQGPSGDTIAPSVHAEFSVNDGTIRYRSLPKNISGITISGTFDMPSGPIAASAGMLSVDRFSARAGSGSIAGKLRVTDFSNPEVSASVDASVDLAEVKEFYPLDPGTTAEGTIRANIVLAGEVNSPHSLNGRGTIGFTDVTIRPAGTTHPVGHLNGALAFSNESIDARKLSLTVGESDLQTSMTIRHYLSLIFPGTGRRAAPPSLRVGLISHRLRASDFMNETPPVRPDPQATSDGGPGIAGLLPAFDISADVSVDTLITEKFILSNTKGTISFSGGVATLASLKAGVCGGTIQTNGTLDLRPARHRPFSFNLEVSNVESHELLAPFTSFGSHISGRLTMKTSLRGTLNDTLGIDTQSLAGDGLAAMQNGKVTSFPLALKLAEATGMPRMKDLAFDHWTNSFTLADGRMHIRDLAVTSGRTEILADGSQGLDGALDYAMTVKFPSEATETLNLPGPAGVLLDYFKDSDGRLTLRFHVGGTVTSPSLELDARGEENGTTRPAQQKYQDRPKNISFDGVKNHFNKP